VAFRFVEQDIGCRDHVNFGDSIGFADSADRGEPTCQRTLFSRNIRSGPWLYRRRAANAEREQMFDSDKAADPAESFEMTWHGDCLVATPASSVEAMRWDLIESAAGLILGPLKSRKVPMVIFDLSRLSYFGSVFLALLLQCHKLVKSRGGELVLCGVGEMGRELLRVTSLDLLWAIYDSREEALAAIAG
jgi:anti-anti-sigma factor